MLNIIIEELVRRVQPHLRKLRLWQLILLFIFVASSSMLYLAPGGIPAAAQKYLSSIYYTPRAIFSSENLPLSKDQEKTLGKHIKRLTSQLIDVYNERGTNEYMNSWAVSQVVIGSNDESILQSDDLRTALLKTQDGETGAWKDFPDAPYVHIPATCWVLLALHKTDFGPTRTLEFLLKTQDKADGSWSMYPVVGFRDIASTYATTMAILALDFWVGDRRIDDQLRPMIKKAMSRGVNWLLGNHHQELWIWNDYPQNETEGSPSVALTSLVVHALSKTSVGSDRYDLDQIASVYLDNLPSYPMTPWTKEVPGIMLTGEPGTKPVPDTSRYYVLPWLIIATVDAYGHAGFRQRVAALEFVDELIGHLEKFAGAISVEDRPWIAAEYLIALRYLAGEKGL